MHQSRSNIYKMLETSFSGFGNDFSIEICDEKKNPLLTLLHSNSRYSDKSSRHSHFDFRNFINNILSLTVRGDACKKLKPSLYTGTLGLF